MKMRMKIIVTTLLLCLITAALFFSASNRCYRVNTFGLVKVGGFIPSFAGVGIQTGKGTMRPAGKFFVFFINEKADPDYDLLDDERYGKVTDIITKKGGHFSATADGKVAKAFGINPILPRDRSVLALAKDVIEKRLNMRPIKDSYNEWALDASLIIVTDGKGKILALYKNAGTRDIEKVVRDLRL